ncbi:hypothetical protein BWQ96_06736 [Gracilariopsis chorda]|uniref:Uncharacterized protein n=1 Tax=Gracilariopsis chorda TaxID=448386 RepID=A0A2V3IN57_9FLOR|nr:hypothetical protein BWQ96_06736 [Gracilariopsis chorda]|eukprot:PXF43508.1 hypothetical protein BWQ96_06736 [Gracilariopsis chorda]
MVVSTAQMMIRGVTAASHSFKRSRICDETAQGQEHTSMSGYDMSTAQSKTVHEMLELTRTKVFLSLEHRSRERLQNVLGEKCEKLQDTAAQQRIIEVENYGKKSVEIHLSAMLPDIFGPLTDKDYK